MPLVIGQILQGRYRILQLLGQGGMGAVYLAEDTRLGRRCAIKESVPDPAASPQALAQLRQQFLMEARTLASLDHPNLTKIYDFFSDAGNEYIVMDYVEGEDLASILKRHGGPLPEKPVLIWADQVLDALEYLHGQRPSPVIHRDIKPANIILTPQGRVKLVDFGLVKLLDPNDPRTATVMKGMGTPEYAPLEQYASGAGHTDVRSDLYSLGATLYHLLTNAPPPDAHQRFVNPTSLGFPRRLNPALSAATEAAILRSLELHPDQRWQRASDMRQALVPTRRPGAAPQPMPVTPTATQAPVPTVQTRRSLPGWLWGSVGVILTLLLMIVLGPVLFPAAPAPSSRPMLLSPTVMSAPAAEPTKAPAVTRTLGPEPTKAPVPTVAPEPTKAPAATRTLAPTPTRSTEPIIAPEPTNAPAPGKYIESPMLTELVKAGKLPPVGQRVPDKPFVVDKGTLILEKDLPDWQPGKFGGTLNFAHAVANWNPDIFIGDNDNLLCASGIGVEGLKPCLLSDFKVSPDNKEFTFTLRKGLKWSDGQPVTTEDVRFTWEDIYGNEKLTPSFPNKFRDGGKAGANPAKLSVVDDLTWKLTFGEPYGGLLRELSIKGWQGYTDMVNPAHFLKQYHVKYASSAASSDAN